MIIFGPLLVIVGIGFICWLLFTLAVFALPFFAGLTIGIWAFHTGAGVLGGIAVGLVAGGVTFGLGQLALAVVPWAWARLLIILLYVAPATVAGYSATHGIAQMAMPSPTWQTIFAVIGAVAVSVTAFVRFTGMAAPGPAGQGLARADIVTSTTVGAGPDHAFRMLAVLVVERGVRADRRRSSPDIAEYRASWRVVEATWPRWRRLTDMANEARDGACSRSLVSEARDPLVARTGPDYRRIHSPASAVTRKSPSSP